MFKRFKNWISGILNGILNKETTIQVTSSVEANMRSWQEWVNTKERQPHSAKITAPAEAVTFNDPPSNKTTLDEKFPLK